MKAEAAPLMLLPGLFGGEAYWLRFKRQLAQAGGPPASALSPAASDETGWDLLYAEADAVILALRAAGAPHHLVGAGLGACVAQIVAAESPEQVSELTLIAAFTAADPWMHKAIDLIGAIASEPGIFADALDLITTSPAALRLGDSMDEAPASSLSPDPQHLAARLESLRVWRAIDFSSGIACPLRIVHAADDALIPFYLAGRLASHHPKSTRLRLAQGGHDLPRSRPCLLAKAVTGGLV